MENKTFLSSALRKKEAEKQVLPKKVYLEWNARIQAKQIATYIQLLAEKGFSLSKNYIDKINEEYNIWELRPGSNRVFFVAWINGMLVLLHAFPNERKHRKLHSVRLIRQFAK